MTYLGLGSNQGDRQFLLEQAIALIAVQVGSVVKCSSFIETEPWGFASDHKFLNAVVAVETTLTPHRLLNATQRIERQLGRRHKTINGQYADRPIDIDVLLIDDHIIRRPRLTIPHPLLLEREFVWRPLLEIAPDIIHPVFDIPVAQLVKMKKEE